MSRLAARLRLRFRGELFEFAPQRLVERFRRRHGFESRMRLPTPFRFADSAQRCGVRRASDAADDGAVLPPVLPQKFASVGNAAPFSDTAERAPSVERRARARLRSTSGRVAGSTYRGEAFGSPPGPGNGHARASSPSLRKSVFQQLPRLMKLGDHRVEALYGVADLPIDALTFVSRHRL
jgi:hypothetical protein